MLTSLKKTYNHFDMGIYLTALNDGKIENKNKIEKSTYISINLRLNFLFIKTIQTSLSLIK